MARFEYMFKRRAKFYRWVDTYGLQVLRWSLVDSSRPLLGVYCPPLGVGIIVVELPYPSRVKFRLLCTPFVLFCVQGLDGPMEIGTRCILYEVREFVTSFVLHCNIEPS